VANRRIGRAEIERRRGIVRRWLRSGESAAEFGGPLGVSQWALYSWAKQTKDAGRLGRRLRKRRPRPSADAAGARQDFVPVQLIQDEHAASWSPDGGFVEIQLRGGAVVRVVGAVSTERIGAVLAAVRQTC
jgi:hypothetical protein